MGLDMYLEGHKHLLFDWKTPANNEEEEGFRIKSKIYELGYWRKHQSLHNYIVSKFADGHDNCEDIELSQTDITDLIADINAGAIDYSKRFPRHSDSDLGIFTRALFWLQAEGGWGYRMIIYRASW